MSDIKHKSVGSLQKGHYCVLEGAACIVTDIKVSRPGKHGHAKVNLTAVGMLDGKKRNTVMPGHDHIDVPIIGKKNAQVLSLSGNNANVMDLETYETFDLAIPGDLKNDVTEGCTVVYWTVLGERVMKQVKSE